jgi:hypothetical protein
MRVQIPEHGPSTLIITRQGLGREARIWLTLNGSIRATAVLDDQQVSKLHREPGTNECTDNRSTSTGDAADRAR